MITDRLKQEVRALVAMSLEGAAKQPVRISVPALLWGEGTDARFFEKLMEDLVHGSVVVLRDPEFTVNKETLEKHDWRDWDGAPGLLPGTRCWVKSFYDGGTYSTHLPYLQKAVELTKGPVLELGAGEGSTPMLHHLCKAQGRLLHTVDNNKEWLDRFANMRSDRHTLSLCADPATAIKDGSSWGVIFIDHAPGETRRVALKLAREKADYIVVHDTEDLGYELEPVFLDFPYRKDFRYARPWTTVVSLTREIWR